MVRARSPLTHTARPCSGQERFLAGGVAGAVSRTVVAPLERLRTIMMADPTRSQLGPVLRSMWADGGVKGLFRGNLATVAKVFPSSAVQFACYDGVQEALLHWNGPGCRDLSAPQKLLAGLLAGGASCVATYPLEALRCFGVQFWCGVLSCAVCHGVALPPCLPTASRSPPARSPPQDASFGGAGRRPRLVLPRGGAQPHRGAGLSGPLPGLHRRPAEQQRHPGEPSVGAVLRSCACLLRRQAAAQRPAAPLQRPVSFTQQALSFATYEGLISSYARWRNAPPNPTEKGALGGTAALVVTAATMPLENVRRCCGVCLLGVWVERGFVS